MYGWERTGHHRCTVCYTTREDDGTEQLDL